VRNTKAVHFHGLIAFGSLCLALHAQASRVTASGRSMRLAEIAATVTVCASQVPSGWIKVDDAWNPTTCGNPTTKSYNVWIIREYAGEPIGAVMTVCNGRAPEGWVVVATRWNPTACSHPITNQKNVMVIQRLN
jgi:membrane-bound ClpP family serine protease